MIDGNATLHGATVETIMIVSGTLALEEGTTVLGNVRSIESTVTQAAGVDIGGDIKGIDAELIALGAFLGPAMLLFAIGMLLASLVAGLLLAAVGTRQVRAAESVIAAEPLKAFGTGLFAAILIPILAIAAIVTIVGAPLGLGILLGALPLLAFVGFLVGGIFLGEVLLGTRKEPAVARPYRGALVGLVLLQVIGLVPVVGGMATAVASILGLGDPAPGMAHAPWNRGRPGRGAEERSRADRRLTGHRPGTLPRLRAIPFTCGCTVALDGDR